MSFDIDVAVRRGDSDVACRFVAGAGLTILFGASGAGKSSVLNMIAGLLRPERGQVVVKDEILFGVATRGDSTGEKRRVGYVFKDARLFPHLEVRANLLYGAGGADDRLAETVERLDVAHLLDRWPRSLSGGEARRVAIGRALLSSPRFLLLDEPLSSLDAVRREEVMCAIEAVRDTAGLPILMVTHDAGEADRLGTRVVRM